MGQAISEERHAILIVEDEAFIRYDLVDFFEDAGFQVFDAENADVAIELMAANPSIRIVLTDVDMPGSMDGVRLAHVIRDRYPPTLLLIASGARKLEQGDMPPGATFIAKPFDPRSLLSRIREAGLPS
ncbi:response regulator [Sphingomonas immobilis]|uniref:Response regulator n=1 Tax=Sphingomonas immobilis TaxID=3063997 RepID=A0ABT8ZYN8_9SPHN|nr:response regulator [Sphingomonas sp. CA1-15]MDO7841881.1 response regulator [Sphingomonas sp. CA1-15]